MSGKNIDENKVNNEVLNLAIEVAQQIHSTGIENWIKKMESQKELPFIKYFEDGFEPAMWKKMYYKNYSQ